MQSKHQYFSGNAVALLAFVVIIIAGLKLSATIILPFLLALFLYILFFPLIYRLSQFGLPNVLTSLIVFGIIVTLLSTFFSFLSISGQSFVENMPLYEEKFHKLTPKVIAFFEDFNISLAWNDILSLIEPSKIFGYTTALFKGMGSIFSYTFLVLLLIIFLLLESPQIYKKSLYFAKTEKQRQKLENFLKSINRYFMLKSFTSALTGFLVWLLLRYFDLQYASLFALLAFLLNYIPSIGSFIAAIPALFVALLQLSFVDTGMIALGYILINNLIGNFLDPKIMGKDLGISTLMIFISMILWGWIFGPLGMFLAVPLTIVLKVISEESEDFHWISVILSDKV